MQTSHLYPGFRFVSKLPSIRSQRELQATLLKCLFGKSHGLLRLLSVGTAYGDELSTFGEHGALEPWEDIWGIDIVEEVKSVVLGQPRLESFSDSFQFKHMDIRDLPGVFGGAYWDCIQCGFVLEDIEYEQKPEVFRRLHQSLKADGILLVSEMFLDNHIRSGGADKDRETVVMDLYGRFLSEAEACLSAGVLTDHQYRMLCGDGSQPGLVISRNEAARGNRDFFDTVARTRELLHDAGFVRFQYHANPVNVYLGVLVASKARP